jgi:ketosteroid isomerase-like protein
MSEENIELVRAFFDAYNARDAEAVDRLLDPDAKITTLSAREGLPAQWTRQATRRYFEQLDEAWAELRVEVKDYREFGDRVVALGVMRGAGKASHVAVNHDFATVFVVRNSQFISVDSFSDPQAAVEAARRAPAPASHRPTSPHSRGRPPRMS